MGASGEPVPTVPPVPTTPSAPSECVQVEDVGSLDLPPGWAPCDGPLGGQDVLTLEVRLLAAMPVHWAIGWVGPDGYPLVWTSALDVAKASMGIGWPVFGPLELDVMALAAENGRAEPADVAGWLARKRTTPGWSLGAGVACGMVGPGVTAEAAKVIALQLPPHHWTVERVAAALGFQLIGISTGPDRTPERKVVTL